MGKRKNQSLINSESSSDENSASNIDAVSYSYNFPLYFRKTMDIFF